MLRPCYVFKQMSRYTEPVIFTTDTGLIDEFMQQIHACAIYKQMDFGENLKHRKNDNELLWGF